MRSPPIARTDLSPKSTTRVLLGGIVALLACNWVAAVAWFQVNVPIWDQWDFFNPLFNGENLTALFSYQHGPHRQGIGFVLSSWVMAASDWDSRVESLWMVALLTISAVLALGLKKRVTGSLRVSDACLPLLVMTLAQWGSVISVPNASHSVFPLLLVLISAHCWLGARDAVRFSAAGILVVCSLFTGFGFFNGVVLSVLLLDGAIRALVLKRKKETVAALVGVLLAGAGWVGFSHGYHFDPASNGYSFPHDPAFEYVPFIALMLAHAAGQEIATPFAFALGGGLLTACLAVGGLSAWRYFFKGDDDRRAGVVFLLMAGGLAFAFFTAVGRIHLGLTAGMASRYITLLSPLWTGLFIWGSGQNRRFVRASFLTLVWIVALLPWTDLGHRPLRRWLGTAGVGDQALGHLSRSTGEKMAWVSSYLRLGDFQSADRETGRLIHPSAEGTDLGRKLAWMKARGLSFFKTAGAPDSWQPWWHEDRCLWLRTYGSEGDGFWMADQCTLWASCAEPCYLNFRVLQKARPLSGDASMEFEYAGATGSLPGDFLDNEISLPAEAGEHLVKLRSLAGTVVADEAGDARDISFKLSAGRITKNSGGIAWTRTAGPDVNWVPDYRWRIVSGFYGWERPAEFGWTDAAMHLELETAVPLYLNIRIDKRYTPVAAGPLIARVGDARVEISMPRKGIAFSLPIPAGAGRQEVAIENAAGAASPHTFEGKADTRMLALRLGELSVSKTPRFPVADAPY